MTTGFNFSVVQLDVGESLPDAISFGTGIVKRGHETFSCNGSSWTALGGGGGSTVDWPNVTSTPTTLAGYGITNAYTKLETDAKTWAFSAITSRPTTLSGYGITDAASSTHNHSGVYQPANTDLNVIAAIGTLGFLKRTGAGAWVTDTSTYLTANQSINLTGDATGSGTTSISVTLNTVPISKGGTGQTSANAALNALLPSQTGNNGMFLTTNGTSASWATASGTTSNLDSLTDVVITTPSTNQILKYDGTNWVNAANNAGDAVLAATQTFSGTNTFSTPIIADHQTAAGNQLTFTNVTSAVNYVTITHAVATAGPTISTAGNDTNVPLNITTKGTGELYLEGYALSDLLKFDMTIELLSGANGTFTLNEYAGFKFTINSARVKTDSGSITASVAINGTNVTGLSAMSITSTQSSATATAANTVNAGNRVTVTTSSNASAVNAVITLACTRAM